MSVLIKGLNVPKCCCDCLFCDGHYYCKLLKIDLWHHAIWSERHSLCPIVEVPTPHGDLVDRDELIKQWEKEEKELGLAFGIALIGAMNEMKKFPIVIESEG